MAYDRYPAPQRRSNQPQRVDEQPHYVSEQPASRTRFYRDKRNGKVFGICAGTPITPDSTSAWCESASSPRCS